MKLKETLNEFWKSMFKKKKSSEVMNTRAEIISEIVVLTRERKELRDKLNTLRSNTLLDIEKEVDNIIKEIEIVKQAIEVNDRKLEDTTELLEKELNVEESGMYA